MKIQRRLPDLKELSSLISLEKPNFNRRQARLAKATTIPELRRIARRRTPRPAFDYVDGAALDEITMDQTYQVFSEYEFVPKMLQGHSEVDLSVQIAGDAADMPVGIAPTGFTRFMQTEGEYGGAGAAAAFGVPFSLSTMGTRSIEEVAKVSGGGRRWFQLYLWKDQAASADLLQRAWANGYDTLLVTVDTPVAGQRLRDVRNGMTLPPKIGLKTIADASYRPEWWFNFLTTDSLKFASLSDTSASLPELIGSMFDPTLNWEDLAWVRDQWPGTLFVKGVVDVDDAVRCVAEGADGVVVSSHGGRQMDRMVTPIEALPKIREALGPDAEIIYDSGVLSGNDALIALALGANFVLIGRAYLYGLMAGGREGVERVLELLREEMRTSLQLIGVGSVDELGPQHVRRRQ